MLSLPALRLRDVGRYFGPPVVMDGVAEPREAWRTLLRIAGITLRPSRDGGTLRTDAAPGHVLRGVSFDVARGSVVCLTGPSGSGKSVLLQILAGVLQPTSGRVEIFGRLASLLSVGSNLDMRITAHENLLASPDAADVTPDEAARYAAEVIAFAELEGFEHVPLRTYSSGMLMRLSVAMVLCGGADIVLIDDVLAVGDIAFQQKTVERVHVLKDRGTTLLLAFSDDTLVRRLATRVVTLTSGRVTGDAPPRHLQDAAPPQAADLSWQIAASLPEDEAATMRGLEVASRREGDDTLLDVTLAFDIKLDGARCRPSVFLMRGRKVVFRTLYPEFLTPAAGSRLACRVSLPMHMVADGAYTLTPTLHCFLPDVAYSLRARDAVTLLVRRQPAGEAVEPEPEADAPVLQVAFPWEVEPIEVHA